MGGRITGHRFMRLLPVMEGNNEICTDNNSFVCRRVTLLFGNPNNGYG